MICLNKHPKKDVLCGLLEGHIDHHHFNGNIKGQVGNITLLWARDVDVVVVAKPDLDPTLTTNDVKVSDDTTEILIPVDGWPCKGGPNRAHRINSLTGHCLKWECKPGDNDGTRKEEEGSTEDTDTGDDEGSRY